MAYTSLYQPRSRYRGMRDPLPAPIISEDVVIPDPSEAAVTSSGSGNGKSASRINRALQNIILTRAKAWADRSCREFPARSNGGSCIDEIHKIFSINASIIRNAYCAKTAWVIYYESCLLQHLHPMLPRDPGALRMLSLAISEGQLRVDTTPVPGAVFYRKSSLSRKSNEISGHIGTVYSIDPTSESAYMISVEGNYSDMITFVKNPKSKVLDPKNGFRFIHTEESWVPVWYGFKMPAPVSPIALNDGPTTSDMINQRWNTSPGVQRTRY